MSGKYSKKRFDYGQLSLPEALKTSSKRATKKTAEANGSFIGNKII